MIDLGNGYFAVPTNYGYNLSEDKRQIDKKTGQKIYSPISYHGSLASCINAALGEVQRKKMSEKDYTLKEAVDQLSQIQRQFIIILENTIGSKEAIDDGK